MTASLPTTKPTNHLNQMLTQKYQHLFPPELQELQDIYEQLEFDLSELDEDDEEFLAVEEAAEEAYEAFRELYEEIFGICLRV